MTLSKSLPRMVTDFVQEKLIGFDGSAVVWCLRYTYLILIMPKLHGLEQMKRVPPETYRELGLLRSLIAHHIAKKAMAMFAALLCYEIIREDVFRRYR
ncbi:MAG: hypothetical protein OZ917_12085 [Candidatus Brocadiaceae bacterium]|nr:hypothetical protein [Candidatus Brocadiaceae bacterium]